MKATLPFLIVLLFAQGLAGKINSKHLPTDQEILSALDTNIPALEKIIRMRDAGEPESALMELAKYFKQKSAIRYYFNWMDFESRFDTYKSNYAAEFKKHKKLADYQMSTYGAEATWKLPAVDLKGREVTAYELRHLSRQQKSADMTLMYYYEKKKPEYLNYFVRQVASLNKAFTEGAVDNGGNAVYESYRAGRRVQNWLFNYNAYLSSIDFRQKDQLNCIRTFLHHGAQLYKRTSNFKYGNHQTKGLTALFEISVMFPEFSCTKQWREHALKGLVWHITHEINADGFQFERSVHYHIGDIDNYFRVYQLALRNKIDLPKSFHVQLRKMFSALVKLAQPNRRLPVFQDDTDEPYAEENDIGSAMTLGTLLFQDPQFRYFADNKIPSKVYWLLSGRQLNILESVRPEQPGLSSCALKETGYYVMRSGWNRNDLYMAVSTGLSKEKPDHQHGDMLGITAYANGHEILPNYQVRYKHPEYRFFKNSWVKNTALADSVLQGRGWLPNRGKSGFGKWHFLPQAKVLSWIPSKSFDYFRASHNGFDSLSINYQREILFIKNKFWLVRDIFTGDKKHTYQQVWQGAYRTDSSGKAVKTYSDGSGLMIRQVQGLPFHVYSSTFRKKQNLVFAKDGLNNFTFTSLLIPFKKKQPNQNLPGGWKIGENAGFNLNSDAAVVLSGGKELFLCGVTHFNREKKNYRFAHPITIYLNISKKKAALHLLSEGEITMTVVDADKNNRIVKLNSGQGFILD